MKNKILMFNLILVVGFSLTAAANNDWKTDFTVATNTAAANNLPIFAYFSGSDWSEDCMRFDRFVLQNSEFQKFASSYLIMFQADYPRKKSLPEDIQKQNDRLSKIYRISKCPTVLLLNSKGEIIATIDFDSKGKGTTENYIKTLKKALGI